MDVFLRYTLTMEQQVIGSQSVFFLSFPDPVEYVVFDNRSYYSSLNRRHKDENYGNFVVPLINTMYWNTQDTSFLLYSYEHSQELCMDCNMRLANPKTEQIQNFLESLITNMAKNSKLSINCLTKPVIWLLYMFKYFVKYLKIHIFVKCWVRLGFTMLPSHRNVHHS